MIKESITKLIKGQDLTYEETYAAMNKIMTGEVSDIQISAFLTGLASKGETNTEIAASAAAMRDQATPVQLDFDSLDIVGTGGDKSYSFNISSTAALVIAAAGQPVAKHGNRSASSKSGAADCLEALGVNLYQDPELVKELLEDLNISFMFAQNYHKSMANVAPVRQDLGIKTVFNLLGPITNPAKPAYQVLGVYKEDLIEPLAEVIKNLGVKRGLVVYGQDVMDEISISAPTSALFFDTEAGMEERFEIKPQDYGFPAYKKEAIVGGSPEVNAQITRDILSGKEEGAKRDIVLLNAGAGLFTANKAKTIQEGIDLARQAIDSGQAADLLEDYIQRSQGKVRA